MDVRWLSRNDGKEDLREQGSAAAEHIGTAAGDGSSAQLPREQPAEGRGRATAVHPLQVFLSDGAEKSEVLKAAGVASLSPMAEVKLAFLSRVAGVNAAARRGDDDGHVGRVRPPRVGRELAGGRDRVTSAALLAPLGLPTHSRNPTRLQREPVRREVLATFTSSQPIYSLVMIDEEHLTEVERARMRADRIDAQRTSKAAVPSGSSATDGGGAAAPTTAGAAMVGRGGAASGSSGLKAPEGERPPSSERKNAVTQNQLIQVVESMHASLKRYWAKGERVKSLRIAIQAAKLMTFSAAVPQCYPSMFVLAAQVLDTFGDLVAQRLQNAAAERSFVVATLIQRGHDASDDLIPPEAIETCYNWFLKINSIRELLPRICIELSLLKCFKFMAKKSRVVSEGVVQRLGMQIRGIADPLVAAHLRWYLFTRAEEVLRTPGWATIALKQSFNDTLDALEHVSSATKKAMWSHKNLTEDSYWHLFVPAMQWQVDVLAQYGDPRDAGPLVELTVKHVMNNLGGNPALLYPLLRGFSGKIMLQCFAADELLDLIAECKPSSCVTRLQLWETLCLSLAEEDEIPLARAQRSAFLGRVWGHISSSTSAKSYVASPGGLKLSNENYLRQLLDACGALLQFTAKHMGSKQVSVLLGLTRTMIHSNSGDAQEDSTRESMFSMLAGLLGKVPVAQLLDSGHFVPLLRQVLPRHRRLLCTAVLRLVLLLDPEEVASLSSPLLELVEEFHNVIPPDACCASAEARSAAREDTDLLCIVLLGMLPSDNTERRLRVLCDIRRLLPGLDRVKATVVRAALAMANDFAPSSQSKRRSTAKACLVFCQLTAPAIMDPVERLQVQNDVAALALNYGFLVIGEAVLADALATLENDVVATVNRGKGRTVSQCRRIMDIIGSLVCTCVIAPPRHVQPVAVVDHDGSAPGETAAAPRNPHLYALRRLLEWNAAFAWPKRSHEVERAQVALHILTAVSCAQQRQVPQQLSRCPMARFDRDPSFLCACSELGSKAAQQLIAWLERYKSVLRLRQQGFADLSTVAGEEEGEEERMGPLQGEGPNGTPAPGAPLAADEAATQRLVAVALSAFDSCVTMGALTQSALVRLLASSAWDVVVFVASTVPSITYSQRMVAAARAAQTALGGGEAFDRLILPLFTAQEQWESAVRNASS